MGGAFGAGFSQGLNQSMQQSSEQQLKKMMIQKYKAELDIAEQKMNAQREFDQNPSLSSFVRAGLGKPQDYIILQAMGGMKNEQQQTSAPNIGMNYEEPTTPQMTFGPELTGAAQMPNMGGITPQGIVEKELLGRPYTGVRSFENKSIVNGQEVTTQKDAFGNPIGQPVTNPIKGEWKKTNIPGVEQFIDNYGNFTGKVRQGEQEFQIEMKTNPDGTQTPVYLPKQPNAGSGLGTPQKAMPGQIQMVIDPTKPGAIDEAITGLQQVKKQGVGQTLGTPSGSLKPPTRGMYLKNEDLKKYINTETGERPKGNWTEEMLDSSQYVKEPEKKLATEEASKLSNGIVAIENLPKVRERLFPNGQLDQAFAQKLWTWYKSPEAMANSEVAPYGKMLKQAGEAQIRLESGAAVPPEEIKRLAERYTNQLFSTPEAIATGFDMLSNSLGTTVEMVDPSGFYRAVSKKSRKEVQPQKPMLQMKGNGKAPSDDIIKQYLAKHGNNPAQAKAAAKKDGWKVD